MLHSKTQIHELCGNPCTILLLLPVMVNYLTDSVAGNVVLTYPTARKHSTDFLSSDKFNNCGVPKGNSLGSLAVGTSLDVVWHLSSLLDGRYEIELVDLPGNESLLLSPSNHDNSELNSTTEQYRVELPQGVTCHNCTLRLSRLTSWHDQSVKYTSCADIDIVDRKDFKETCSNSGRAVLGRCRCENLYHGDKCQFKNNCESDRHCGRYGKCLRFSSNKYHRKRCACKIGYYGDFCQHKNPTTMRRKPASLLLHSSQQLSPTVVLYWRLLADSDEMEIVVRANTTSYVAVGWRPRSVTVKCQHQISLVTTTDSPHEHAATEPSLTNSTWSNQLPSTSTIVQPQSSEPTVFQVSSSTDSPGFQTNMTESSQTVDKEDTSAQLQRARVSGMQCVDMVIGRAEGDYGLAGDYFSYGTRTPQLDEVYGGEQSLSAVMVFQEQDSTTLMFRRKINAEDDQDHGLRGELDVIWALGQKQNIPSTIESQLYRQDQIRYHGGGDMQRGSAVVNFTPEQSTAAVITRCSYNQVYDSCGAEWLWPPTCSMSQGNCQYAAKWEYLDEEDAIHFIIQSSDRENWLGIGFSSTASMTASDIIMAHVQWSGRVTIHDRWSFGHLLPSIDAKQNLRNVAGAVQNGRQQISFVRDRNTSDTRDLAFTDSQCLFMLFPVGGGKYSERWKRFSQHQSPPLVSSSKICIKSCNSVKLVGTDGKPLPPPPPPFIHYDVRLLLRNVHSEAQPPQKGTEDFSQLRDRIVKDTAGVFSSVSGFKRHTVTRFISSSSGPLVQFDIEIKRKDQERELRRAIEEEDKPKTLSHILNDSVREGSVGYLKVNPQYFYLQEIQTQDTEAIEGRRKERTGLSDTTRAWLLVLVIGTLIACSSVQGYHKCRRCSQQMSSKDPQPKKQSTGKGPNSNYWRQIAERANRLQPVTPTNHRDERPNSGQSAVSSRPKQQQIRMSQQHHPEDTVWPARIETARPDQLQPNVTETPAEADTDPNWDTVTNKQYERNWREVAEHRGRRERRVYFDR